MILRNDDLVELFDNLEPSGLRIVIFHLYWWCIFPVNKLSYSYAWIDFTKFRKSFLLNIRLREGIKTIEPYFHIIVLKVIKNLDAQNIFSVGFFLVLSVFNFRAFEKFSPPKKMLKVIERKISKSKKFKPETKNSTLVLNTKIKVNVSVET